ncbi:hypothetical protein ACWJKU_14540 [Methylocaldum sp. MU1018]
MNDSNITKSANRLPLHTDWERYETPAAVRKHGRQFLERIWRQLEGERPGSGLERIAQHFGARSFESEDATLLFFEDADQAAACARLLQETGEALSIEVQLSVQRRDRAGTLDATVLDGRTA